MELSASTQRGVQLAGSSAVNDSAFSRLALLSIQAAEGLIEPDAVQGDAKLAKLDQACCKEAFSSLMTLVLEAARTDTDAAGLGSVLEDSRFAPERIKSLQTLYAEHKAKLRSTLAQVGSSLPHVVDVDWRLDYYIKNNHLERVDKPIYLINLKTEVGATQPDNGSGKIVQFACTQEQLQDLVGKLKDASKAMERFSQQ